MRHNRLESIHKDGNTAYRTTENTMFALILIIVGFVFIAAGSVAMVITTVQKLKNNDDSERNTIITILAAFVFFAGTLLAAIGGNLPL